MNREELRAYLEKAKPLLLLALLGVMLLLLSGSSGGSGGNEADYSEEEEKLAEVLSRIEGVGKCSVLLREGSRKESIGAVVVCEGAKSAGVCLNVKEAVRAYTGLGSDKIIILKSKQGGK